MTRRVDEGKLQAWRKRLATFEAGGLSVAEFCRRQKLAPTQFYYWLRRVRAADVVASDHRQGAGQTTDSPQGLSRIEVFLGDSVRLSLPTDDPALVASVLHELRASSKPANAFELVDVVAER